MTIVIKCNVCKVSGASPCLISNGADFCESCHEEFHSRIQAKFDQMTEIYGREVTQVIVDMQKSKKTIVELVK